MNNQRLRNAERDLRLAEKAEAEVLPVVSYNEDTASRHAQVACRLTLAKGRYRAALKAAFRQGVVVL